MSVCRPKTGRMFASELISAQKNTGSVKLITHLYTLFLPLQLRSAIIRLPATSKSIYNHRLLHDKNITLVVYNW
jgi:hypothetical protein